MAQNVCVSRLDALRKAMEKYGIDVYMIPTADFHGSEYVADYFKVREYFSGFTGENSTLVVTKDEADLWVDGRFFIQAEHELEGSGIIEQRMGEPGVPTLHEFLRKTMRDGETLGFDGRCVNE
ncbi:MAG TPA: peptidase M24, partial [Lachnospiraceae bacterium]|nr:peptidase M24 [Lachnospiraceae bacterium]